jgi:hypothetical protein
VLRIPKSLHRELAGEAEAEGVSLNTLVSNVLASRHTRKEQQYLSLVTQMANQSMGSIYSVFSTPEKANAPSNLLSMSGRQQSHRPYQNIALENEQTPEKELQYAGFR